jgi:aldose sugar dehydrogenase
LRALVLALALLLPEQGRAVAYESKHVRFCAETALSGLTYPVALLFLSDDEALVAERPGRLSRWNVRTGQTTSIDGVPTTSGLLKVVADPDFRANRWIYISYARRSRGEVAFGLARARLGANSLGQLGTVFTTYPPAHGRVLHAGALLFLPDRSLLVSVGSDLPTGGAPVLTSHLGAVVRLMPDGRVPADNPFLTDPHRLPEIFTYGHRNIQGLAIDPETGLIWATEHGPEGGDELNVLSAGNNYGWPLVTGKSVSPHTNAEGAATHTTNPAFVWQETIAPTGVLVYRQKQFPEWRGDFFIGSLAQRRLDRLRWENRTVTEHESLLADLSERIRDVVSDPAGNIYALTDAAHGRIIRLTPCQALTARTSR